MSKLTDRISYLQGLAEGLKLNAEKDSNRLILEIINVLGEVGDSVEALTESHGQLGDYVESIDEDLADLEAEIFGNDEDEEDGDDGDSRGEGEAEEGPILYECPHCHTTVEIDPEGVDFNEAAPCPSCGKELFPELPEESDK